MAQNNGSKILLVVKNRRFNVFYRLSLNRGEKGKNSPLKPRQTPSAKIGHVGAYFAKMGCKIEDRFSDIFGVVGHHLGWAGGVFCLAFAFELLNKFRSQKKKIVETLFMAQPSLFFPLFDFTLMNVYMNTEIRKGALIQSPSLIESV